jgi:hypothetical protein
MVQAVQNAPAQAMFELATRYLRAPQKETAPPVVSKGCCG